MTTATQSVAALPRFTADRKTYDERANVVALNRATAGRDLHKLNVEGAIMSLGLDNGHRDTRPFSAMLAQVSTADRSAIAAAVARAFRYSYINKLGERAESFVLKVAQSDGRVTVEEESKLTARGITQEAIAGMLARFDAHPFYQRTASQQSADLKGEGAILKFLRNAATADGFSDAAGNLAAKLYHMGRDLVGAAE